MSWDVDSGPPAVQPGVEAEARPPSSPSIIARAGAIVGEARFEYVFLVIALIWGVVQVFLVPPLQVPDEGDHWFRAWAMTDGQLTADRQATITLPASFAPSVDLYRRLVAGEKNLPISLEGQPGFSGYEALFDAPASPGTIKVPSRVANYGPIGYLPQAAGIFVGRLGGAPPLVCFYLARVANLLVGIALLFLAIRLAPFGKQLFVLFGLLPMTMFELASASCDALTISGSILFIALVLWATRRPKLGHVELALLLAVAAILLNIKPGYWGLALLVLLIRPGQLGGRRRYAAFVVGTLVAVGGVFLLVFAATSTTGVAEGAGGPREQLQFIATQPLAFLDILWSNIRSDGANWTLETIGAMGWLTVTLPPAFYLFVPVAAAVLFVRMGEEVHLGVDRRALLVAVAVAVFLTIAIALYAFLEHAGSGRIFFQGRYLAPVWLLLLLSVYGTKLGRRYRGGPFLITILVLMMAQNFQTLVMAYRT